ncbi:MAG: glycine--tRNA ligase subunit beta [Rhodothalassiaceae bacterium]
MSELLLELLCEEIPARMQARAAKDLQRLVSAALTDAGLSLGPARSFATPRRLTLVIQDVPARTPDRREERRGPRVGAPDKALEGFLRGTGLRKDQLDTREDKKGAFYYAVLETPGRPTADLLAEQIPGIIAHFPWPKSMRWGADPMRWVRPLHSILCLLDGAVVTLTAGSVPSAPTTRGHRFLAADAPIPVTDFADYQAKLRAASVILDPAERRTIIRDGAERLAADADLTLVPDTGLLDENAGLTEWPVPLLGRFDPAFLEVPEEAVMLTLKTNQKVFSLRGADGALAPAFICVANLAAPDGGAAITAGNERVIAARLADARFFWQADRQTRLEDRVAQLDSISFHDKLGSVGERVRRIEALAAQIAETSVWPQKGAFQAGPLSPPPLPQGQSGVSQTSPTSQDAFVDQVRLAARLAKADLVSQMVYEFPELQGTIGQYLARAEGLPEPVAHAIEAHYAPKGPDDPCPTEPVAVCVALAEKLDTLVGFFGIDEKPTGSKDPFALRRAALGVIRLVVENRLRVPFVAILTRHDEGIAGATGTATAHAEPVAAGAAAPPRPSAGSGRAVAADLMAFFADRLKVQQREAGTRHDLIDAVFALGGEDDLVRLLARVAALQHFVGTEDGANLLAGYKRAANILKKEEAKDEADYGAVAVDPDRFEQPEEHALAEALTTALNTAARAVADERFEDAMAALAALRRPIDAFFDQVTVNAEAAVLRTNRLALLARFRAAVHQVADFSKIEG